MSNPLSKHFPSEVTWSYDRNGKVTLDSKNCITGESLDFLPVCGAELFYARASVSVFGSTNK